MFNLSKTIKLCALLLLLLCTTAKAQKNCFTCDYDSLVNQLNYTKTDKQKIELLLLIIDKGGMAYRNNAIDLIDQLVQLNSKTSTVNVDPYRHYKQALEWWNQQQYEDAVKELKISISLFDESHKIIYEMLATIRNLFIMLNEPEQLKSFYQQKLNYYQLNGPYQNTASCYHALGWYYLSKADYNLAITNYLRAASVYRRFNLNYYYNELIVVGNLYEKWGNLGKARLYLNEALPLSLAKGDSIISAYALVALSRIALKNNNEKEALNYSRRAVQFANTGIDNATSYASALLQQGLVYIQKKDAATAFRFITEARNLSEAFHGKIATNAGEVEIDYGFYLYYMLVNNKKAAEQNLQQAYKKANDEKLSILQKKYLRELSTFYETLGQSDRSLQYLRRYFELNDVIDETQNSIKVAQFENEEKDKLQNKRIGELREQKALQDIKISNKNLLVILSLVGLSIVLALLVFIYRQLIINKKTLKTLRRTQRQLILSEKMASLGEMTSGVAHEIQNPMNFIKNFSEVSEDLAQDAKDELDNGNLEEVKLLVNDLGENLGKIKDHAARADAIIKGMLMHARQSAGNKEQVKINELVNEYLRLSYHTMRGSDSSFNAELVKVYAAGLPEIECMPQQLGRVFINLFNNSFYSIKQKQQKGAANYTPTVWVTTAQADDDQLEITIRDNGMGIRQDIIEKIFQPFYTTKPAGQGTGLGLSLSYDIVTKGHDGTMEVNSVQGEFAEFIIRLPVG